MNDLEKLFNIGPLKLGRLTMNSDINTKSDDVLTEMKLQHLDSIRKIVFNTAQMNKEQLVKEEKQMFEEMEKEGETEETLHLVVKTFYRGQQNAIVSYANNLIKALEMSMKQISE